MNTQRREAVLTQLTHEAKIEKLDVVMRRDSFRYIIRRFSVTDLRSGLGRGCYS